MTRLRMRRHFIRPWYVPTPGEDGDEMAFIYDGATYTYGTLTAGSGTRTLTIEFTLADAAITSGTAVADLLMLSDSNIDASTFVRGSTAPIDSFTGCTLQSLDAGGAALYHILLIKAATGHITCTLTFLNETEAQVSCYPCILLPNGGIDIGTEFIIPATSG